jgi:sugar lactone lactonase YvrE
MTHSLKHVFLYTSIALLAACGSQESAVSDKITALAGDNIASTAPNTVATQATETTTVGTSPKRDLLANLALAYPGGVLPAERAAAAAEQLAQNPAALKYNAPEAQSAASKISPQAGAITPQAATTYTVGISAPVQRAQNTTLFGSYFFSIYPSEMSTALATNPTWNLEGTAFHASLGINPGLAPVYRFRNLINGSYLYTINEGEKADIIANYSTFFTLEGTAWHASAVPATGFSPLYRFRNLTNGTYLFSAYEAEKDAIVANYVGIFLLEGISYYVRQTAPLEVSLFAGSLTAIGGSANGTGDAARFNEPEGIAQDSLGNLYVADFNNHAIRKITPDAVVTTFAGVLGTPGVADGTGAVARFRNPVGIVYLPISNRLLVTDSGNHTIREISMAGTVITLAGLAGTAGAVNGSWGAARFNLPRGIAISADGQTIVVADTGNQTIRQIFYTRTVTTLAGLAGTAGSNNGTGAAARFTNPHGVALDASNNAYIADRGNSLIRKITPAGLVTTLAGGFTSTSNFVDGTGSAAQFRDTYSITSDGANTLYVADGRSIRKVTTAGVVTQVAGTNGNPGTFAPAALPAFVPFPNGIVIGGGKTYFTTGGGIPFSILQINGVP